MTVRPPSRRREAPGSEQPTRHRGRWVGAVAGVFVVAAVMVLHSPWLSLSTVDIVGSEHADVEGRLASADVGEGAIMLWLSPGEVEEAVVADPWVREARVERVLPDTLVVEVLEHTPALWIEGETGWMLVGRDGSVLEHTDRPGDGLLRVALGFPDHAPGSSPDAPAWREVVSLAVSVPEMAGAELSLDEEGVRSSVSGIPVHFGPPVDLADKGRVLLSVLAEGVPADWSIDLVAPRRPVLVPPSLKDQAELEVEGGASST